MALPVTIGSASLPDQNYYCGPFKAPNQAIYLAIMDTASPNRIQVFKATDPTSSFSAQDSGNRPTVIEFETMWSYLSGSEIHIVDLDSIGGSVRYHVFDTSSDTWTTINETVEILKDNPAAANVSVSIAVRSDGDKIVLYNGDIDKDMGQSFERVDYARKEGSTWTFGIDVGGTSPAAEDRTGSVLVRGSVDNMHFFWINPGISAPLAGRSLASNNTLGTRRTRALVIDGLPHPWVPGIAWDDGGTWRIIVPFEDGTTDALTVVRWEESSGILVDAPGSTVVGPPEDVAAANGSPIACAAIDGDGRMYIMWSGGGAAGVDKDLWRSDAAPPYTSWAAETEVINATTINRISCNVYPRDGAIKLAFVYDEAGTIKYNEVSITAPPAPAMADSRFPDQNYKIGPYSI